MTETQLVQTTLLSSFFVLFGVFAWMPVTRGARAFFGVHVEPAYFDGEGKHVLRRYRVALAAAFFVVVVAAVAVNTFVPGPMPLITAEFVLPLAAFVVYMRFAAFVRPHAVTTGATRFASSMRSRTATSRVWVEAIVATFTALAFVVPLLSYNEMPQRIPVHWGLTGKADRWAERSAFALLFIPVLGVYMQFVMHVLRRDIAGAKMTLPADATEEYLRGKERYLKANIDTVDWARVMIGVTFASVALLQTFSAVDRLRSLVPVARTSLFAAIVAMQIGIIFFLVRMVRINSRLQQQLGNDYAQRAVDERHWIHGGLTYSNPEDPALVVEKLVGVGYTLNMAHPGIRNRLIFMLGGIPLFILWAIVAL